MKRAIATLSMFSVILVSGGFSLAVADDQEILDQPECTQHAREVGASCPYPAAQRDAVGRAEIDMRDVAIPMYVPPARGSTLVHAGSEQDRHGARRPGQRL